MAALDCYDGFIDILTGPVMRGPVDEEFSFDWIDRDSLTRRPPAGPSNVGTLFQQPTEGYVYQSAFNSSGSLDWRSFATNTLTGNGISGTFTFIISITVSNGVVTAIQSN